MEIEARKAAGDKTLAGFVEQGNKIEVESPPEITVRGKPVALSDLIQTTSPLTEDEEYYNSLLPKEAIPSGITIHHARGLE